MSKEEFKKQIINEVMLLLRSGKIRTSTPNADIWSMVEAPEDGCSGFDWMAYKATVAAQMLRPIYEKVIKDQTQKRGNGLRSASDVAIDETIDIAVDMAERLEGRLKGGDK